MMYNEILQHFNTVILPFWKGLKDDVNGGYISYVGQDLKRDENGERGCILNSRILWFFSQAILSLKDKSLQPYADHAYSMLLRMMDRENGGVYWSMNKDGSVYDSTKHTYNQAFAIYALSTYYDACGNEDALKLAMELFQLVENRCRDEGGYLEAQTANFQPLVNDKLSENGVIASRTMNTLLHVLEAYTELYRVNGNEDVRRCIYQVMDSIQFKLYNPEKHRLEVFFDADFNPLLDMHSYGHDIETSWLADRALEILSDDALTARIRSILQDLVCETYRVAYTPNGFYNECVNGVVDKNRVWWVQAEAVVGFLNAYEKMCDEKYLDAVRNLWKYISNYITDPREGSEWFWMVGDDGKPVAGEPIVEPWKCPYHNGRMIFEVMRRKAGKEI